ncbi:MAG: DUF2683 family protein [Candidatus Aenigmatarchaeota archaeon]
MPQSIIRLSEHANRVVNVVKAKEGLKDKSAALESIIEEFEENILDPSFRPEFTESLLEQDKRIRAGKEKVIKAKTMGDLF